MKTAGIPILKLMRCVFSFAKNIHLQIVNLIVNLKISNTDYHSSIMYILLSIKNALSHEIASSVSVDTPTTLK